MKFATALFAGTLALFATPQLALAQGVGHSPSESPYRDIPKHQRLTVFAGYFLANDGEIGAMPGSAPLIGGRYEVTISGPAQFYARVSFAPSKRNAYDPSETPANRSLGKVSAPLTMADLGVSFNLTGQKSWRHLVPTAGFGIGVINSMSQTENDPFKVGTRFAFSTDLGIRYLPEGRPYELRVNAGTMLYQTRYPSAYFEPGGGGTTLLGSDVARAKYRANWMMSAGLTYPIFR